MTGLCTATYYELLSTIDIVHCDEIKIFLWREIFYLKLIYQSRNNKLSLLSRRDDSSDTYSESLWCCYWQSSAGLRGLPAGLLRWAVAAPDQMLQVAVFVGRFGLKIIHLRIYLEAFYITPKCVYILYFNPQSLKVFLTSAENSQSLTFLGTKSTEISKKRNSPSSSVSLSLIKFLKAQTWFKLPHW